MKASGFTLFELLICLALVVLISTLALSTFRIVSHFMVRAEVDKLFMVCRYLQQSAMVTHSQKKLTFDVQKNSYAFESHREQLSSGVEFGTLAGIKGPPSSPFKHIADPVTFTNHEILFNHDGIIKSGTVYYVDSGKSRMYALSSPVAHISYLRKYRYATAWHGIS